MGQVPLVDQALREECDVKQSEMQHDFRTADEKES